MSDLGGRPQTTEAELQKWLDEMAPFLKMGQTLWSAIEDAGLEKHKTTIYENSKLDGWFSEKIKLYQQTPGKLANNILIKRLMAVDEKIKQGLPISDEELKDVRFVAEKHRTAQPYFVTRTETAEAKEKDIGKVVDTIERDNQYERMAKKASGQMVAPEQPVQDQE